MSNLNDIVNFVQVVEAGGLSAAAAVLRISPSHVSRRLRALEEEMGVQLIKRSTRHISLTEEGELFYKKCAPALAILNTAQTDTTNISDVPHGTLRVHTGTGIGPGLVSEAAVAFKHDYPDVAMDLYIDSDPENLMPDGYDIVIKSSDVANSSLISEDIGIVRDVVVASSAYLEKAGRPKKPSDLTNFNCLVQYGRRSPGEWRFVGPKGDYAVKVSGSLRSTNAHTLCKATAKGIGIACIPKFVVQSQWEGSDLEILFDDCVVRKVKAYYPRSQHPPAKIKIFLQYLRASDERRSARMALLAK
jgi:DNA-binding transcriptional LysR family regulator